MATVMMMEWPGVTQDQYNRVMSDLGLDKNPPVGAIFHVAGFTTSGLRVLDIWDSQQAFERFQKERLAATVQKVGITGQPNVQFLPVHNLYTPNIEAIRKAGASSLPS
jgi:hypothetical protein